MSIDWKDELERRSVAQRELAERAGLHLRTVSALVTGERKGHPVTRRKLAEALAEFPILLPRKEASILSSTRRP